MKRHRTCYWWLPLVFLLGQSQDNDLSATELRGFSSDVLDKAYVHFPVYLTEGSLTPGGDYYVRFRRQSSEGLIQYDSASFRIVNGRIEPKTWSQATFLGANDWSGHGVETSLICQGAVYAWIDGINDPIVGTAVAEGFSCIGRHLTNSFVAVTNNINLNLNATITRCVTLEKPGTTDAQLESLNAIFKLGSGDFGNAQAQLQILSRYVHSNLCTPTLLNALAPSPGFEVLNSSNAVRQVLGPSFLLEVTQDSEDGSQFLYKVNLHYRPDPLSTSNGFYLIPTNSVPFKVITVENPNTTNNYNTLLISENTNAATNQTRYVYDPTNASWTLELPGSLSKHKLVTESTNATEVVERKSIYQPGTPDVLIYSERNRYSLVEGERMLVEQVLDPDTAKLTNLFVYYTASNEFRYKRLNQKIAYDGFWEKYDYDTNYFKRVTPFNHSANNAAESQCRVLEVTYATAGVFTNPAISTTEKVMGQIVAKSFRAVYSGTNVQEIVCQDPNAAWNDTNNLVTITRYYNDGHPFKRRLASIKNPDGTLALYSYATNATELTTTISEGQPGGTDTNSVAEGTQTILVEGTLGESKSRTVYPIIAGNVDTSKTLVRESYSYSSGDPFKLTPTVTNLDGTITSGTPGCCAAPGPESITDKDGTTTSFTYDALRRRNSSTTLGITTTNILDALGRSLATIRIGTNGTGSQITLQQTLFDVAGRRFKSTNALSGVTTNTEGLDGNGYFVRTNSYPNGGTRIATYLREGALKELSGTAVHPARFEYDAEYAGTNSAGTSLTNYFVREIRLTSSGGTNEWTKTYYDLAGRPWKTVYAGATTPTSLNFYNNKGQLTNQVDPDGVTNLFQYNGKGELEYTVLDMDRDGVIDLDGTDRVTRLVSTVITNGTLGTNVFRTQTFVWTQDTVDASIPLATLEQSLEGLRTWTTISNGTTAVVSKGQTGYAGSGNRYLTNTAPDGSYVVNAFSYGRLSSVTRYSASGSQIGQTGYGYDEHGRVQSVTDARSGTTTYGYNNADLITSVTSPTPGTGQGLQTTITDYDNMGRPTRVALADGTSVTNEYHLSGALKRNYGSRTYPVGYGYDAQGRLTAMTNWTTFSSAGERVTTWTYDPDRGWLNSKLYP